MYISILFANTQKAGIDVVTSKGDLISPPLTDHRSRVSSGMLVSAHIMGKLGPLFVRIFNLCFHWGYFHILGLCK